MHTFGERKEICGKAPALKIIWTIGRKQYWCILSETLFWRYSENQQTQTRYLQSAAYLRCKNIQLGYTLPKSLLSPAGISNCRIYLSCDNLFTITSLSDIFDPEAFGGYGDEGWGSGKTYPLQRTVSVGVNLSF